MGVRVVGVAGVTTQSGIEHHSMFTPSAGQSRDGAYSSAEHRESSPRTPTGKRLFPPLLGGERKMVRDGFWNSKLGSGVGSNRSELGPPQKRLLEAEIEKLRGTNKNQRRERTNTLQQNENLEADLWLSTKNTGNAM